MAGRARAFVSGISHHAVLRLHYLLSLLRCWEVASRLRLGRLYPCFFFPHLGLRAIDPLRLAWCDVLVWPLLSSPHLKRIFLLFPISYWVIAGRLPHGRLNLFSWFFVVSHISTAYCCRHYVQSLLDAGSREPVFLRAGCTPLSFSASLWRLTVVVIDVCAFAVVLDKEEIEREGHRNPRIWPVPPCHGRTYRRTWFVVSPSLQGLASRRVGFSHVVLDAGVHTSPSACH